MIYTQAIGRLSRVAAAAAAAALIVGATVPASAAAGPDGKSSAKQADDQSVGKERRYCVQAPTTGTILPHRLCKTRSEWIKHDGFDPALQQQK